MADVPAYEAYVRQGGEIALQEMEEFFMQTGKVHQTLRELVRCFNESGIPYAVIGALAVGLHGFTRVTVNINVLLTAQGLEAFRTRFPGYVPAFPGAERSLRSVDNGVRIDVIFAGQYPGDGLPKPVRFPDPAEAYQAIDGVRVLSLTKLIELKLASGMTAPHRRSDLGDVQKMVYELRLPADFADYLDASVQPLFRQIWQESQTVENVEDRPPGAR